MTTPEFPELGFYGLAGQPASSRDLLGEVREGEALGLGTAFISERYNKKEAAALCGAAAAVSESITIATGATHNNTRHPLLTAGFAYTMQSLSGGRFVLGIGRGIPILQQLMGIPEITTAEMEDFAGIMRRLFRGEMVANHDGPAGRFPLLLLDPTLDEHLPMNIACFGENSLRLGGRCFDEVILHTYFADETVVRCVETVKSAAIEAGRDPDDVRVWSCLATIVGKFPSTDEMTRTMAVAVRAYSREVGFYNRLRSGVRIATPYCYYAAVRDHGPEFVILLEDMHPAEQGDQIAGCGPSLARRITLALVGLHGPTWRDTSLAGAEWLSFDDPEELHNAIRAFFRSVLPEFLDRHRDELAAEQKDLFQRLADSPGFPISPPVGEAFCAIHQDYRLDNLLLDTTRTPAAVTVVDWQSLAVGHPLSDVSYFLGGNLQVDQRRSVEERIVRDYHDALLDFGVAGLGWAECWEAYRRASIFGLATVVFASMGVERAERGDRLIATMARRHTTHALDLGAEEFLG